MKSQKVDKQLKREKKKYRERNGADRESKEELEGRAKEKRQKRVDKESEG